ncbi:hypothetical protein SEA_RICKMORE_52 [Gordonia phage Rickmore]|uniref:Uncharacterized protein n=1 Tax=Gordonia phage Rickmore TaxID=2507854 RepID=A0A410TB76_9CAUD|nr:helix-turn-helix DNA binding protein [Gordonia phage Rickmore]QAU06286.1 hypothetical protein SEA_RICKMORE_52 [Gordonia phage Rickmore]
MLQRKPTTASSGSRTTSRQTKKVYIVGGTCLTVGVAVGATLVAVKSGAKIDISVVGDKNNVVGKAKTVNQVTIKLIERSTPSKPVHLVGTNLYFNSLSEAARETSHHLSMISKNVNGLIPDVKGDVFELLEHA